jgi:flagellar hook-associated protein 1 FlgK
MFNTLNVAQSGLAASQTQVENVMNNIANENTDGYKKRVVDVKEAEINDDRVTGRGAVLGGVSRITNIYMYDNLIDEKSKDAEYSELSTMLADIESLFFETEDSGLSKDLDSFFQAIEDLRSNPYNDIYRTNLINKGNIIVDNLQTLYQGIEDRETISQSFITDHVAEVNGILHDIGAVNKQIIDSQVTSNDLLDERDRLEARLAEYMEISVDRSETYSLDIGNMTAVRYDTNIHEVRIVEDNQTQKDVYASDSNISTLFDGAWGVGDSLTYSFDKDTKITVTYEEALDEVSLGYDVDGDGVIAGSFVVNSVDKIVRALAAKINTNSTTGNFVTAYNGQYSVDEDGNKIPMQPANQDHYLIIESKKEALEGSFEGRIIVNDDDKTDLDGNPIAYTVEKNNKKSLVAADDFHLEIFDEKLILTGGKMKPILDNLNTLNENNKFDKYKDMLDNFAKALSDITESYIFLGDGEFISGEEASLLHKEVDKKQDIGLFEGATINTLSFNDSVVGKLSQQNLDYLATIHWNEDINIDGDENTGTSFSKYLQNIRVSVSADKENVDYLQETQEAVTQSLQLTYDKLVKVDKDDEMVNLIKFQAAYEANAKLITVVDEMLATILGMKR